MSPALFSSPFYGEDFYFEIPRAFQYLSFYVYATTVIPRALPIGKPAHTYVYPPTCLFNAWLFVNPGHV